MTLSFHVMFYYHAALILPGTHFSTWGLVVLTLTRFNLEIFSLVIGGEKKHGKNGPRPTSSPPKKIKRYLY